VRACVCVCVQSGTYLRVGFVWLARSSRNSRSPRTEERRPNDPKFTNQPRRALDRHLAPSVPFCVWPDSTAVVPCCRVLCACAVAEHNIPTIFSPAAHDGRGQPNRVLRSRACIVTTPRGLCSSARTLALWSRLGPGKALSCPALALDLAGRPSHRFTLEGPLARPNRRHDSVQSPNKRHSFSSRGRR